MKGDYLQLEIIGGKCVLVNDYKPRGFNIDWLVFDEAKEVDKTAFVLIKQHTEHWGSFCCNSRPGMFVTYAEVHHGKLCRLIRWLKNKLVDLKINRRRGK